ncbi:hypothetical protein GCM10023322_43690 [Rugosimonospora acidiphila]|uniref:Acetyltransferase (GNAT) family protein n=1 Tax=Rugosimonospora acidiphila TaxID=556531 RepID=A0ABP9S1Z1_9ACTN
MALNRIQEDGRAEINRSTRPDITRSITHAAWPGCCLLHAATAELESWGHRRARLWVLDGNEPAQHFYRSRGWRRVDGLRRDDDIEGVPVVEIAYERDLRPGPPA